MEHTTTQGKALAIAAGVVFLAGTLGILFEDVLLKGAPLALKHGLTLAILAGTIMVGHLANSARSASQWASAAAFSMVFVIGTVLVVLSSVGRQTADTIQTTAQIEADAGRRVSITQTRNRAVTMLERAQADLASECKTGDGKACRGIKATIEVYKAAVAGHDADLAKLGPVQVSNAEAEQLAEIMATLFGIDKAKVKAAAVLLTPFATALFLEFGVIVSFGFAFRHRPAPIVATVSKVSAPVLVPETDENRRLLRKVGRPVTNNEFASLKGVTKGEASKQVSELVAAGIVSRRRVGKEVAITLN
ncbi:MAG: hypothetical protein WBD27_19620 [Pyrinomonadaceae bacterium]